MFQHMGGEQAWSAGMHPSFYGSAGAAFAAAGFPPTQGRFGPGPQKQVQVGDMVGPLLYASLYRPEEQARIMDDIQRLTQDLNAAKEEASHKIEKLKEAIGKRTDGNSRGRNLQQ